MKTLKIFFDGGCRPNPGTMELAVVVRGQLHLVRDAGIGTSLDGEWLALLHALRIAKKLAAPDILLLGDALAVIEQANGRARCRGNSLHHFQMFRTMAVDVARVRVRHVKRTQNLAGVALALLDGR